MYKYTLSLVGKLSSWWLVRPRDTSFHVDNVHVVIITRCENRRKTANANTRRTIRGRSDIETVLNGHSCAVSVIRVCIRYNGISIRRHVRRYVRNARL